MSRSASIGLCKQSSIIWLRWKNSIEHLKVVLNVVLIGASKKKVAHNNLYHAIVKKDASVYLKYQKDTCQISLIHFSHWTSITEMMLQLFFQARMIPYVLRQYCSFKIVSLCKIFRCPPIFIFNSSTQRVGTLNSLNSQLFFVNIVYLWLANVLKLNLK